MKTLISFVLSFTFLILLAQGTLIRFFSYNANTTIFTTSLDDECQYLPQFRIHSIKADSCTMLYRDYQCKSIYKLKFLPGKSENPRKDWKFGSFHECNDKDGGGLLIVDITEFQPAEARDNREFIRKILYSYRDLCECVNLPSELNNGKEWSINNHANELLVYYEQNCAEEKWNADIIGIDSQGVLDSILVFNRTKVDILSNVTARVKSIGPNPQSTLFKSRCTPRHLFIRSPARIRELMENIKRYEEKLREANKELHDQEEKQWKYIKEAYNIPHDLMKRFKAV